MSDTGFLGFDERDKDLPALVVDVDELDADAGMFVFNIVGRNMGDFADEPDGIIEAGNMEEKVNVFLDLMPMPGPDKHSLPAHVAGIVFYKLVVGLVGNPEGSRTAFIGPPLIQRIEIV
jgi:hypothetical protein